MKEQSGEEAYLWKGSPSYHSSCFSLPTDPPPASVPMIHHLKHHYHWTKSHNPPNAQSLGRKHGPPLKYEEVEPSGDEGKRITILSIDGGGVRGVIPSTILEQLEAFLQVHSSTWSFGSFLCV